MTGKRVSVDAELIGRVVARRAAGESIYDIAVTMHVRRGRIREILLAHAPELSGRLLSSPAEAAIAAASRQLAEAIARHHPERCGA